jgi:hypothetical protein
MEEHQLCDKNTLEKKIIKRKLIEDLKHNLAQPTARAELDQRREQMKRNLNLTHTPE